MQSQRQTVLDALPGSKSEIIAKTGLDKKTVLRWIGVLHLGERCIHIGRWKPHPARGPSVAVYVAGPEKDAKDTLPRLSKHDIYLRHEKKIRGTERYDVRAARHRNRYWKKKAASSKQQWFSALL